MILDIDVPARAWRFIAARTSSLGADTACVGSPAPFTGLGLTAAVLGLPPSMPGLTGGSSSLPVADAVNQRAAVLVNRAGRVALVVAPGVVVQPCGRQYALTPTTADWWVAGWWPGTVTRTVPPGSGVPYRPPGKGSARGSVTWGGGGASGVTPLVEDLPEHPGLYFAPTSPPLVEYPPGSGVYLVDNRFAPDPTNPAIYRWVGGTP